MTISPEAYYIQTKHHFHQYADEEMIELLVLQDTTFQSMYHCAAVLTLKRNILTSEQQHNLNISTIQGRLYDY